MSSRPVGPHRPRSLVASIVLGILMTFVATGGAFADGLGLLQDNTDGDVGVYVKEIGGDVREAANENFVFEGASTNKTMIHVHAMSEIQAMNASLGETVSVFTDLDGSCPLDTGEVMESLEIVLRRMMVESDNPRTQAVRDRFGDADINMTMQLLGMSSSMLNPGQTLGCGAEALASPNALTAADLGRLYEQVLTGFLDETTRDQMFALMLNETNSFYINRVIDDEALAAGLTAQEIADFKASIRMAHKGGNYTLVPDGQPARFYVSLGGYVELPYGCEDESRQFTYVAFVDNASSLDTQGTGSDLNIFDVGRELLRPVIREAVESAVCARAPVVDAPYPVTLECNTEGGVAGDDPQVVDWLGMAGATDECDEVAVESDAPDFFPSACAPGFRTEVTFSATDECGVTGEAVSSITVQDTTAPSLVLPAAQVLECTSPDGAEAEVIATGEDVCSDVVFENSRTGLSNDASGTYPIGETTVAFDVVDTCQNHTCGWTTVTVQDTVAPVVACSVDKSVLWPPNHEMVDVGLEVIVEDTCDEAPLIDVSVTSDEHPKTAPGAGGPTKCPDAFGCADGLMLRAERSGSADGRVYVITVTATDNAGNVGTCQTTVSVPKSMSSAAVDSGQEYDAEVCDQNGNGHNGNNGNGPGSNNGNGPGSNNGNGNNGNSGNSNGNGPDPDDEKKDDRRGLRRSR